jgi:hypothetical protein
MSHHFDSVILFHTPPLQSVFIQHIFRFKYIQHRLVIFRNTAPAYGESHIYITKHTVFPLQKQIFECYLGKHGMEMVSPIMSQIKFSIAFFMVY